MRIVNADALREAMYHEAFETDTDMQKWDSGCWIRYKMFENVIDNAPTIDAVEVVRCKYCKWWKTKYSLTGKEYNVCGNETIGVELFEPIRKEEDFCSGGERREDNAENDNN